MILHPLSRKVAASAALVVTVSGLSFGAAPAQAVVPTLGSCATTGDSVTQTITMTADCDTYTALQVPNGWTLDGTGHKIVAVQDQGHQSFTGPALESATGDDSAAATMNVRNLTVTSRGFDLFTQDVVGAPAIGIRMVRAGGSLTDVTVDGIAHNVGQLSRAILIDNQDAGSNDVPRADVTLNRVTTTRFQKSGVFLRGNLGYDARHLTVGQSANVDGSRNLLNASNGIVALSGAHGSITDSTVGENRYPADDGGAPGDVVSATSMLLEDVGNTVLARNVIEGTDGDTGILVDNYTNDINSVIRISCSTLIRHDDGNGDDNAGAGVWNDEGSTPGGVSLTLASNTFSGWHQNVRGDATMATDPACSTGNKLSASDSSITYGGVVTLSGLVRNANGSAANGTTTLQKRESASDPWSTVTTTPTNGRYSFRLSPKQRMSYRTAFAGDTFTSSTSNAVTVQVVRKVTATSTRSKVKNGVVLAFTGTVTPEIAGRSIVLQQRHNGGWVNRRRTSLSKDGSYDFKVPAKRGSSNRFFRVVTTTTSELTGGVSRVMQVSNLS